MKKEIKIKKIISVQKIMYIRKRIKEKRKNRICTIVNRNICLKFRTRAYIKTRVWAMIQRMIGGVRGRINLQRRWYWVGIHRWRGRRSRERLFAEWRINRLRVRGNTHRALIVCKMSRCLVKVARERNLMSHTPLHQATARRLYHSALALGACY